MAIIYGYSSRNFSIYRTGDVKLVTKMRGVRSPNYDPSRHGTGWTSKMPDRRALTLLDNPKKDLLNFQMEPLDMKKNQ